MKKKNYFCSMLTFIMMVTMVCVGFTSCGDDDESSVALTQEALVGKWICTQLEYVEGDERTVVPYTDDSHYIVFDEDGKMMTEPYYLFDLMDDFEKSHPWSVSGNKIIIEYFRPDFDGQPFALTVTSLTEETLVTYYKVGSGSDTFSEKHTFRRAK